MLASGNAYHSVPPLSGGSYEFNPPTRDHSIGNVKEKHVQDSLKINSFYPIWFYVLFIFEINYYLIRVAVTKIGALSIPSLLCSATLQVWRGSP